MDDTFAIIGIIFSFFLIIYVIGTTIILMDSYNISTDVWNCTDFNIKQQDCVKYERTDKP